MSRCSSPATCCIFTLFIGCAWTTTPPGAFAADDNAAEKAVVLLKGEVTRDEAASGRPIVAVSYANRGLKAAQLAEALRPLRGLPALRSFECSANWGEEYTDSGVADLTTLPALRSLTLGRARVSPAALHTVGQLQRLEILSLWGQNRIDHAFVRELLGLQNLKELSLGGGRVEGEALRELWQLPSLQTLDLEGADVTPAGFRALQAVTNLRTLQLTCNGKVGLAELKEIGQIQSLEGVDLFTVKLTDDGLKELSALSRLRHLRLCGGTLTAVGFGHLQRAKNLESLELRYVHCSDDDAAGLSRLTQLRSLDLDGLPLTDAAIPYFKKMTGLRMLGLRSRKITSAGWDELREALPNTKIEGPE